jgi:hypothetical protein
MSETVTDQETTTEETPAEETSTQLPSHPDAPAEGTETPAEPGEGTETPAQQPEAGRPGWNPKLAKAHEEAAELRRQNAKLLDLLAEAAKAKPATTATQAAETVDEVETIVAQAEALSDPNNEKFDPSAASLLNAKATRMLLKRQQDADKAKREEAKRAEEASRARTAQTARDSEIWAALKADWKQRGIAESDGVALVTRAQKYAKDKNLTGAAASAVAEDFYARELPNLKRSKLPPVKEKTPTTTPPARGKAPAARENLEPGANQLSQEDEELIKQFGESMTSGSAEE